MTIFSTMVIRPLTQYASQGPEVFDRLMRFLLANFPVARVEEEGDIVVLQLDRSPQDAAIMARE